jgi:hypothetical protein
MRREQAKQDGTRTARVISRRVLRYEAGAERRLDRPAHVRSGSALAIIGGAFVVVQDDAAFLAVVRGEQIGAIPLPDVGGVRVFDDVRGNKAQKYDLEACIVRGDRLYSFGSGSSPMRENILITRLEDGATKRVDAHELYRRLRVWTDFSGSELNLEGATVHEGRLWLFNRGNGARIGDLSPVDASCTLDADAFFAWLEGAGPLPDPGDLVQYDLGAAGGVRLTFTDATSHEGRIWYLAVAEDSPDAVRDGPVSGLAIGTIGSDGVRYTLVTENGAPIADKAEGLAFDPSDAAKVWMVVDRDDPDAPSELLEVALG